MVQVLLCQTDRAQDAYMGATTAEVSRQGLTYQGLIRIGVLLQQAGDTHQDATAAVATLGRLLVDEGLQHQPTNGVFR
jgi:hypothetical protein